MNGLKKRKENPLGERRNNMGIKERLQAATSEKEVDTLLQQGKCLTDAPEATKRRWKKLAKEAFKRISAKKNENKKSD